MALLVQKYGGTSVADAERIRNVARRISARRKAGDQLVVVVSAMGDSTDRLISLAREITAHPEARELDLLLSTGETVSMTLVAMALHDAGEILVSNVVRELAAGKAFLFSDRGEVALRGFADPARLYDMRWQEEP